MQREMELLEMEKQTPLEVKMQGRRVGGCQLLAVSEQISRHYRGKGGQGESIFCIKSIFGLTQQCAVNFMKLKSEKNG